MCVRVCGDVRLPCGGSGSCTAAPGPTLSSVPLSGAHLPSPRKQSLRWDQEVINSGRLGPSGRRCGAGSQRAAPGVPGVQLGPAPGRVRARSTRSCPTPGSSKKRPRASHSARDAGVVFTSGGSSSLRLLRPLLSRLPVRHFPRRGLPAATPTSRYRPGITEMRSRPARQQPRAVLESGKRPLEREMDVISATSDL